MMVAQQTDLILIDEFERRLQKCREEVRSGSGTNMNEWYPWLIDNGPKMLKIMRNSNRLRIERDNQYEYNVDQIKKQTELEHQIIKLKEELLKLKEELQQWKSLRYDPRDSL